jgi:hypothetical protein
MIDFFSNSIYWKSYTVDNLLVAKMLHDRGFNVNGLCITEAMFGGCLELLFGGEKNVTWEQFEPSLPEEAELILEKEQNNEKLTPEEEEASYYINSYFNYRDHYKIIVVIPDLVELHNKLRPKHYKQLMAPLKEISHSPNSNFEVDLFEEYFPWYELIEEVEWVKGEDGVITGFWMHLVDVEQGTEEPVSDLRYHEAFISFWDTLQSIKKKVLKNNRRSTNKSPKRRQGVRKPGGERGDQRKTDQSELPVRTGEGHAA